MGPHHPATHGVLRLIVTLQGERVLDLKPVMGYLHTGIEKSCEDKSYWKVIPFVERMDYLSYFFQMEAFCGCVERLLELEIPPRAEYLRVLHMELNRIHSHLVWLGTSALDLGAISMFWYCFRERDQILDLFEMSTGQRMHTRYFQVGGVFEDIPVGFEQKVREFCAEMPSASTSTRRCSTATRSSSTAPRRRDRLPRAAAGARRHRAAAARRGRALGSAQGDPLSRVRRLRLQDPGRHGRRRLRPLPRSAPGDARVGADHRAGPRRPAGGAVDRRRPQVRAAARDELSTSMEALIHHFKLVTEGFRVPPGELYYSIESPRGELGCFVLADGSSKPARVHFRDPSFVNLQAFRDMSVGGLIADLIQNLAMLDPIIGGSTGEPADAEARAALDRRSGHIHDVAGAAADAG